jgi:hypothetical protein
MDNRRDLLYDKFINESHQFIYKFVKDNNDNNKTILDASNEKYYMNYLKNIQIKIFNEKFRESMLYNIDDSLIFLNKLTINEFGGLLNNPVQVQTKRDKLFSSIHQLLDESTNTLSLLDYSPSLNNDNSIIFSENTKKTCIYTIGIKIFIINISNNSFNIDSNIYTILPGHYTIEELVENINQIIELDGKIIYNKYVNKVCFIFNKTSNLKLNHSLADLLGFSNIEYSDISKVISEKYNQIDIYKNGYIQIKINDTKLSVYHTNNNLGWFSAKYPQDNVCLQKYFDIYQKNTIEIFVYNANLQEMPSDFYNINCTFKCL